MRRGLAGLILGLSLLVASVAWSGFVLLHTVLDPGRSESLADEMLDNSLLREAMVDTMADAIETGVPGGVVVPRAQLEAAAGVALDDPRVEAVVRDGFVRMHQNALNGVDEPVVIDPSAFGASARDALVAARPELDAVLPPVPPAAITLPDTGLSFLGDVRDFLDRTVAVASLAALAGAVLALLITTDRPGVLRRVAMWAFAASAFWLIIGYGVPWLAQRLLPGSAAVFAAGVEVLLGAMILPALLLAGAGLVLVVLSVLWDGVAQAGQARSRRDRVQRGAPRPVGRPSPAAAAPASFRMAPPPPPTGPATGLRAGPRDGGRPPYPVRSTDPVDRTQVGPSPAGPWSPTTPGPAAPTGGFDPWDHTRVDVPQADAGHDHPEGLRRGHGPRWVEGVGYVDE